MNPIHHPSDALLIAYASGAAGEAEALAIAAHGTFCPDCRAKIQTAETVGGVLLERIPPSPIATDGLPSLMNRIAEDEDHRNGLASFRRGIVDSTPGIDLIPDVLPKVLGHYVAEALSRGKWRTSGPGVRQLLLHTSGAAKARLIRLKPGTRLPKHSHRGVELTLLLAGSYTDEIGHFARGDMVELDDAITHQPVVDMAEECIALAVTEAPVRFCGLFARLAQPLIGI